VGLTFEGEITGVRMVPPHNETPGLGDKIDIRKSDWMLSFNGKSLGEPVAEKWAVKKDGGAFDSFTGATITPRAVVGQVKRALDWYDAHRDTVFAQAADVDDTEHCDD
jgi:electron transport complex protein RnfG